jgi:hypothetical protein
MGDLLNPSVEPQRNQLMHCARLLVISRNADEKRSMPLRLFWSVSCTWILPQLIATDSAVRAYTSNVPNAFSFISSIPNELKEIDLTAPTRNSDSNIKEPVPLMPGTSNPIRDI